MSSTQISNESQIRMTNDQNIGSVWTEQTSKVLKTLEVWVHFTCISRD
jgi:hypothetical protein